MPLDLDGGIRWQNWPIPEPFVMGMLVGWSLHLLIPLPIEFDHRMRLVGSGLFLVGLGSVVWAVRAVGHQAVAAPAVLVTTGPYRYSHHPMYVGWSGIYLGIGLLAGIAWLLALIPLITVAIHRTVRREEQSLERRFGAEYRRYRRHVPRYLGLAVIRPGCSCR